MVKGMHLLLQVLHRLHPQGSKLLLDLTQQAAG